jgi:PAS domain S-box-containing protein
MSDKTRINILIVDDQPGKLLTYEAVLEALDENLVKANSAKEAFDCLLRNEFAVVLVDVCMPELDGYQLASMIREHPRFEKTPIIFISAIYLSDLDRLRGYESGAVDYMPVPVVPEILRAKVKVFVDLHRKTRELERLNQSLEDRVAERTAELRSSNERLRLASEAARFGTYECRFPTGRIHCSAQMKSLLGQDAEGDFDLDYFFSLIDPSDRAAVRRCMMASQRDEEDRHQVEFRVPQKDGSVRWLLDCGRAFFEDAGRDRPARVVGTVLDVTERKHVEERQLILMAELDHRVKNILANVSAIAKLSSKQTVSVEHFVKALDGRIQAISRAHSLLRRDSWTGIDIDSYLREILAPFIQAQNKNIVMRGEPLTLIPKAGQSLALALHELATNAAKYGSLSVPGGSVQISWSRITDAEGGVVRIVWKERGGPSVAKPDGKGFGSTVIGSAATELGAKLTYEFEPDGVIFILEAPIEQGTVPSLALSPLPMALRRDDEKLDGLKFRVLIVEDEPLVALQVKGDLEAAGHKVVGLASSVSQGLTLADTSDFDVAFLDIRLGDDLSTPVAERILERGIPFAFGSGFEDNSILPLHLRRIPRLAKPYEGERVAKLLSEIVNAPDGWEFIAVKADPLTAS